MQIFPLRYCLLIVLMMVIPLSVPGDELSAASRVFVCCKRYPAQAVIDAYTDKIITEIPTGRGSVRSNMTPDGKKLYVSNNFSNTVSVIDTVNLVNIKTIPVGEKPHESAFTPDGTRLFVVHTAHSGVTVIDTATDTVVATVPIPGDEARHVLLTLDGLFAYVANYDNSTVDIINTLTFEFTSLPVPAGPRRLVISPAGDRVFVTNHLADSVSVIDTNNRQLTATIPVGHMPRGIALSPGGETLYVTNVKSSSISIVDTHTLTAVDEVPVGLKPWHIVVSPDGAQAFVSNSGSSSVSIINTGTREVVKNVKVGRTPFMSAPDPHFTKLYVANVGSSDISVIDIARQTVTETVPVCTSPFDLAFAENTQDIDVFSISGSVRTSDGAPIPGVTVALSAAEPLYAVTDIRGRFRFTGITNGTYTMTPGRAGCTFFPASRTVTVNGYDITRRFTGSCIPSY